MTDQKNDPRSVLKMVGALLIMSTIGLFRRYIPLPSALLAFLRGVLGAGSLLLLLLIGGRGLPRRPERKTLLLLVLSGAAIGVNWMLLFEAYRYTTIATATLCYYAQPTIVLLLSPLLFREKLTPVKLLCAAAAVAGMILVSGVTDPGGAGGDVRGVLFGLGAAVFYASVVILNKLTPGTDPYGKTVIQLSAAAAVMVPYLLLAGGAEGAEASSGGWLLVLVVGVVHTGLAYALYFASMDGLRAQTVALLSYLDPVVALLLSWLVLREPATLSGVIGAVLVLGAAAAGELVN